MITDLLVIDSFYDNYDYWCMIVFRNTDYRHMIVSMITDCWYMIVSMITDYWLLPPDYSRPVLHPRDSDWPDVITQAATDLGSIVLL